MTSSRVTVDERNIPRIGMICQVTVCRFDGEWGRGPRLTVVNCTGFAHEGMVPTSARSGHACLFREDDRA